MAKHNIEEKFSVEMEEVQPSDRVTAEFMNQMINQLLCNDAFLKKIAESATEHMQNAENPHKVTAEQVGLGNVPNVKTNEQTPTYTESSSISKLVSGEKLSAAFGKIAAAVSSLISHIGNKSNPHSVTVAQLGAIAKSAIVNNATTNSADKVASAAVAKNLQDQITTQNNNLTQKTNGRFILPNGLKIFWGSVYTSAIPANSYVKMNINFPLAFGNTEYSCTFSSLGESKVNVAYVKTSVSVISITVFNLNSTQITQRMITYMAIGY